jgi:hypothetical protein
MGPLLLKLIEKFNFVFKLISNQNRKVFSPIRSILTVYRDHHVVYSFKSLLLFEGNVTLTLKCFQQTMKQRDKASLSVSNRFKY